MKRKERISQVESEEIKKHKIKKRIMVKMGKKSNSKYSKNDKMKTAGKWKRREEKYN